MKFLVINSNALHVDCIIHLKFFERTSWLEKYENMGFVFKCVNKYILYLSSNYHPGDVQYTFLHQISIYSVHHACPCMSVCLFVCFPSVDFFYQLLLLDSLTDFCETFTLFCSCHIFIFTYYNALIQKYFHNFKHIFLVL